MKWCYSCNNKKNIELFSKQTRSKDGLQSMCKACETSKKRIWREKNSKRQTLVNRTWYLRNREQRLIQCSLWAKENPEKKLNACMKRYRLLKKATPKWLSEEDIAEINQFYADAKELQWLNSPTDPLQVDHIVPLQSKFVCGLHVPWNLRIIPRSANSAKGSSHGSN